MRAVPKMPPTTTKRKVAATSLPSTPVVASTPTQPTFRSTTTPKSTTSITTSSTPKATAAQVPALAPLRKRTRHPAGVAKSSSLKHTKPVVSTRQLYNDRLGMLVQQLCLDFQNAESWEAFVNNFRGRSYLSPERVRSVSAWPSQSMAKGDRPAPNLSPELAGMRLTKTSSTNLGVAMGAMVVVKGTDELDARANS